MISIQQTEFTFRLDVNTTGFAAIIQTNFGDETGAKITLHHSPFTFLATSSSTEGPFSILATSDGDVVEALFSCFNFTLLQENGTPLFNISFPVGNTCLFPTT